MKIQQPMGVFRVMMCLSAAAVLVCGAAWLGVAFCLLDHAHKLVEVKLEYWETLSSSLPSHRSTIVPTLHGSPPEPTPLTLSPVFALACACVLGGLWAGLVGVAGLIAGGVVKRWLLCMFTGAALSTSAWLLPLTLLLLGEPQVKDEYGLMLQRHRVSLAVVSVATAASTIFSAVTSLFLLKRLGKGKTEEHEALLRA